MSYRFLLSIVVALSLTACSGGTIPLAESPAAPGAQGTLNISEGTQGTLEIKLDVTRLAAAEKVIPGAIVYVVWAAPTGGTPQNLGELTVGDDLKGHLETKTPLRRFELFVTAEELRTTSAPSGPRVLSARVNQ
jgi:hypothetical protein